MRTLFDRLNLDEAQSMKRLASSGHIEKRPDGGYRGVTKRGKAAMSGRRSRGWERVAAMGAGPARKQRMQGGKHPLQNDPRLSTVERGTKGRDTEDTTKRVVTHLKRQGRDYPEDERFRGGMSGMGGGYKTSSPFEPKDNPRLDAKTGGKYGDFVTREKDYQKKKKEASFPLERKRYNEIGAIKDKDRERNDPFQPTGKWKEQRTLKRRLKRKRTEKARTEAGPKRDAAAAADYRDDRAQDKRWKAEERREKGLKTTEESISLLDRISR